MDGGRVAADGDPRFVDDAEEERYELWLGDARAGSIEYQTQPGVIVLIHTEIGPEFQGRGLATRVVADALRDIRARGLKLVPVCSFVRDYLRNHPEQWDLVLPRAAPR
jgi:uncharacterized protein